MRERARKQEREKERERERGREEERLIMLAKVISSMGEIVRL